jgi:hypothetical protein
VDIDLAAQSAQNLAEAARIMGTIFYNPTMNGCNWPKLAKWSKLAAAARTDDEFDYVANRFLGEMNATIWASAARWAMARARRGRGWAGWARGRAGRRAGTWSSRSCVTRPRPRGRRRSRWGT